MKDLINLLTKRMDSLPTWKEINSIFIQKSITTNHMSKRYKNLKATLENINNKSITLKENLMDGKEKQNKLIQNHKEFKVNFSSMFKKRIVYQICWKLRTMSTKLWEDHWPIMKQKQEKYKCCKPLTNNLM